MARIDVQCCIAGGGPAGLVLGLLLAREGVNVVVLEKHADFLRDFRGDTIHPSTMEVMAELGWIHEFLALPHEQVHRLSVQFGDERLVIADFSTLPVRAPFVAMMPQWDFLDFLARKAGTLPNFQLRMNCEAHGLIRERGRVVGVAATGTEGPLDIHAKLCVAADGRHSTLRAAAGLDVQEFGAPMDVLWFRLSRRPTDTAESQGRFDRGRIFIMLNRGDYWQCAYVIAKGAYDSLMAAGIEAFRNSLRPLLPVGGERADEIGDWEQIKLLTVQVDRLKRWWQPGLLCIGDAAHAMSPIAGVGVNLAVQDAVAAANLLAQPLRSGSVGDAELAAVQRRREWPTRMTQRIQLLMQRTIIASTLEGRDQPRPPLVLRLLTRVPGFKRIPARLIGLGIRPEHVRI